MTGPRFWQPGLPGGNFNLAPLPAMAFISDWYFSWACSALVMSLEKFQLRGRRAAARGENGGRNWQSFVWLPSRGSHPIGKPGRWKCRGFSPVIYLAGNGHAWVCVMDWVFWVTVFCDAQVVLSTDLYHSRGCGARCGSFLFLLS